MCKENKCQGRSKAKGKYQTNEELIEHVFRLRNERNMSFASVARCCQISRTTVQKILNSK